MVFILLTLEKHQSGVWNSLLIDRLEQLQQQVVIVTLESTLLCASNPFPPDTEVVINRVSDASDLYKATVALLECCQLLWNIKVWNAAYAMIVNKWCHSAIFERACLATPTTWRTFQPSSIDCNMHPLPIALDRFPILFKPNAGGFGAGIVKYDETPASLPKTNDDMAVLQEYIKPYGNRVFRVWFLLGKVQCGLVRVCDDSDTGNIAEEFTTGCAAGGACSIRDRPSRNPTFLAYQVPEEVCHELETQLIPLLSPLAHCGSVEYLCNMEGKRFYFDINLLSTLPIIESVENAPEVWGTNYDPWMELATAILQFSCT